MKNRYKVAALIFSVVFLIFLPHSNLLNEVEKALSEKTILKKTASQKEGSTEKKDHRKEKEALLTEAENLLKINQNYAMTIYDLNNHEEFGLNETTQFHAASIMKLLVATSALEEVEKGKYKLSSPLGNTTFKNELQQMINQSNNYSWDNFNNLLGFRREQETADRLSLAGVNVFGNQMTTKGVGQLLLKLYQGEILTTEHRDLLFSYMQNTETENRISKGIPPGVNFYHKTGSYNGGLHDAAIVIHPKNPFILVIFTNDTKGLAESERFAAMANTTKAVYKYFSNI